MRPLGDFHLHTCFCDGRETPAAMAAQAHNIGLSDLGFSAHAPLPFPCDWCMPADKEAQYRQQIAALRAQYRGSMHILCGVEADDCTAVAPDMYDYIIRSVHFIEKDGARRPVDESPQETRRTVRECFGGDGYAYAAAYFGAVAAMPVSDRTIIGHFDLVAKFNETDPVFDEEDARYLTPALEALSALPLSAPLEINTGAIFRGRRSVPYPTATLLRAWKKRGGEIILSSDAHTPAALCYRFDDASALARACGFDHTVLLTETGMTEVPLAE